MKTTTFPARSVRRAADRGVTKIGWLDSKHSFSFGRYYDPDRVAFRSLRVLNDDIVKPGFGFGEHPHDNMEIITWVLRGAVRHRDSTGSEGVLKPGELQVMSAGSGIRHSEVNASRTDELHLLQIWIMPDTLDLTPAYGQREFDSKQRASRWQTLASPDGRNDSMIIHQNAVMSVTDLQPSDELDFTIDANRHGYLHIAFGSVTIDGVELHAGDAITFDGPATHTIRANDVSQIILFDLA